MVSHRSGCQNMCARFHWLHWSWLFVGQSWTHGSAGIREILWGIINLINNDQDGAQGGWYTAGVLSCCLSWWSFEARHSQSLVLWSLKNYELQWVGGASCCLLRFGEELVQKWSFGAWAQPELGAVDTRQRVVHSRDLRGSSESQSSYIKYISNICI